MTELGRDLTATEIMEALIGQRIISIEFPFSDDEGVGLRLRVTVESGCKFNIDAVALHGMGSMLGITEV